MTRILAVSHTAVWPVRSGSSVRRLMTLAALSAHGVVDLLYVGESGGLASAVPDDAPIGDVIEHPIDRRRLGAIERGAWALRPTRPLQALEWAPAPRPLLERAPFDLVWYFRAVAFSLVGPMPAAASVVDLDDLEDEKLRGAHLANPGRGSGRRRFAERRNIVAWRRYQRSVARDVDAVTVCAADDCRTLAAHSCFVLPNGVPHVDAEPRAHDTFTMLFVGLFEYEPNADAAEFMVEQVMPIVRRAMPQAELRLVGRTTHRVQRLAGPGVTVVGEVPDLSSEYGVASIAVAPIRFGGGTRIKIIEAFARKVPVVSTTMGASGLGVTDGWELLLADDAASFASACVSALSDPALRARLLERGHALYEHRFSQPAIDRSVAQVLEAVRRGNAS